MRAFFIALLLLGCQAFATPESIFWTFCTTDVVELGKGEFEINNLFRPVVPPRHDIFAATVPDDMLPTDVGLNVGFLEVGIVRFDGGIDYFGGVDNPLFFNVKGAIKENCLFGGAPSFSLGIFDIGTSNTTNFNVWNVVFGKTLPRRRGRIFFGGYYGNRSIGPDRGGWWIAYDLPFYPKVRDDDFFYRWHFVADYASGRNAVGGGGFGVYYYLTPDIYLSTGPTWFNSSSIYGPWKWALYLNIDFTVWRVSCCRGCCYGATH